MKRTAVLVFSLILLTMIMCNKNENDDLLQKTVDIVFTINGPVYQGDFYGAYLDLNTDYAVWIQDSDKNFIKTLEVTPGAITVDASEGSHVEHLPVWSAAAGVTYAKLQAETSAGVPASFDGFTGASPNLMDDTATEEIGVQWDMTDMTGNIVDPGIYTCIIETANINKSWTSAGDDFTFSVNSQISEISINIESETSSLTKQTTVTAFSVDFSEDATGIAKSVVGLN